MGFHINYRGAIRMGKLHFSAFYLFNLVSSVTFHICTGSLCRCSDRSVSGSSSISSADTGDCRHHNYSGLPCTKTSLSSLPAPPSCHESY